MERRRAKPAAAIGARTDGPDEVLGRHLERAILELLAARAPGASICPSEAARAVAAADAAGQSWRDLMAPTRLAAARLAAGRRIEVTQRGRVVAPDLARGPIRLRLPSTGD